VSEVRRSRQLARQNSFLAAYRLTASIGRSSAVAKVARDAHSHWMRNDPTYRQRFEAVQEDAGQVLEDAAVERALLGVKRMQFYQGRPLRYNRELQYEIEYSDSLLLALLKRFMPDKYRERTSVDHTGSIDLVERLRTANERLIAIKRKNDPGTGTA
jgi:hypothetical protein